MHLAGEPRLPHQARHREVLNDDGVRPHMPGESVQEPADRIQLVRLDQGVEGHEDAHAFGVRERGESGELLERKVLGLHPRGKRFQPAVDGIRTGRERGQEGGSVPGGCENGRRCDHDFH